MVNIKNQVDNSMIFLIEKLGYLVSPLLLNFTNEKNKLLIFYFHGFYQSEEQKKLNHIAPQNNLTVKQFSDFIDYFLNNKYHFIKPDDLLKNLPDEPYIMLTFDDGYFNNNLAIDILNQYKIPATIFVTAKNVLENKSFWWDVVYKYRVKDGVSLKKIQKEIIQLKSLKYTEIERYLESNFGTNSSRPWSDIDRPFSEAELKKISQNLYITIGNHTYNHSILTNYSNQEIQEEFILSNNAILKMTGITPNTMAFPNGNLNHIAMDIAEKAGFRFVFTVENKLHTLPLLNRPNFTRLNRFMAKPVTTEKYAHLNRLGYSPASLYFNLKRYLNQAF